MQISNFTSCGFNLLILILLYLTGWIALIYISLCCVVIRKIHLSTFILILVHPYVLINIPPSIHLHLPVFIYKQCCVLDLYCAIDVSYSDSFSCVSCLNFHCMSPFSVCDIFCNSHHTLCHTALIGSLSVYESTLHVFHHILPCIPVLGFCF